MPRPAFMVQAQDPSGRARAGVLRTPHGPIQTPVFMPVATQGSVKALTPEDLDSLGVRAILSNAYHLHLRPGHEPIARMGGLHRFMGYDGAILTDSGGFQVMSLAGLRRVSEDGITFKSHLDGSARELSPEKAMEIQAALGSDIRTSLDECIAWPASAPAARSAMERTCRWTERCSEAAQRLRDGSGGLFFPILQGSVYPELRKQAARRLRGLPHDGVSIGGLSVGEPKERTWEMLGLTADELDPGKPRYLMGVGTPEDLWGAVAHGADMMDCVWPTRLARHGTAMTRRGRLNLSNAACREDPAPLEPECGCRVCRRHSRAYLSHLFKAREISVHGLLTYHNLHFLLGIMLEIRRALLQNRFQEAHERFLEHCGDNLVK